MMSLLNKSLKDFIERVVVAPERKIIFSLYFLMVKILFPIDRIFKRIYKTRMRLG